MAIDPKLVSIKTAAELPEGIPKAEGKFLYYEDDTLKTAEMSDLYDRLESSYLGIITPSTTIPTTGSWYGTVLAAGTFNNVTPAITVDAADFDVQNGTANNEVRIIITEGVATKDVKRLKGDQGDPADPAKLTNWTATTFASGAQVLVDGMLYEANAATTGADIPGTSSKWIPKFTTYKIPVTITGQFYNGTTGLLQANSSYDSSVKYRVLPGMKFYRLFMNGFIKGIHFWDEAGNYIASPFNVFSYEAPSNAYEVAFTIPTGSTVLPETTNDFKNFQKTSYNNKFAFIPSGSNLTKIYETALNTDANILTGRFNLYLLDNSSDYRSFIIPVTKGNITLKGLTTVASSAIQLFDKNFLIYKTIPVTNSEMTIDTDEYTAYLGASRGVNGAWTVVNNTPLYSGSKDLPTELKNITENIISNFKKGVHRFKIDFKLKSDINNGSGSLNIISGLPISLKLFYGATTSPVNTQIPLLTHSARLESRGLVNANSIDFGTGNVSIFRGKELFRIRHTGTTYTLYWECTGSSLKLYSNTTVLVEYLFSTYTTIGQLLNKIKEDVASATIPAFEVYCSYLSTTPTSNIAPFTKIQAFKTINKDGGDVQSCFPTYFFAKDESWHTLEVIFRQNKIHWAIDGYGFNAPDTANNTYGIGGELILDFTNFEYRNFKKEVGQEYSFPIVRTIYLHSAIDEMGETTGNTASTIDRALYIDSEFKKRGFKSISYTDLMEHMKFGKPIPKRSYVLCYDDSRIELYADRAVRTKLMLNNIKTNNAAVLSFANDEEIYIKSSDVVITGTLNIGDSWASDGGSRITYLGVSKINSNDKIFKLGNPNNFQPYGSGLVVGKTYTVSTGKTVNFPTSPLGNTVRTEEIPYSEYTSLIQDYPNELFEYGFEVHIHDLKHSYLDKMTYEEALLNVKEAVSLFKKRYKKFPTGIVYPYGAITPDHAKVWDNEGVFLGYSSTQNRHQLGAPKINYTLDRYGLDVGNDVQNYFNNAFMGLDNFL